MSFWDDISDKLDEVSFDDVVGIFASNDAVTNQASQVQQQHAAQGESYYQPTHGTTAGGQPILANQPRQGVMPWYQDPLKIGGAIVIVSALGFLVIKAAK